MNVFLVTTKESDKFVTLGTFDSKEAAKKFINSHAYKSKEAPLELYKMDAKQNLLYSFTEKDLESHIESSLLDRDDDLLSFNYTKDQKAKVVKQISNQIKSYESAIKQLSDKPTLVASLQRQLNELQELLTELHPILH